MNILLWVGIAFAHKPSFSEGQYSSADAPYQVQDPNISIVVYHEVTCESPALWMTLNPDPEVPLYIQLGTPVIERLGNYRPSVALFAEGLPPLDEEDLPFDVPDNLGGMIFDTSDVEEPGDFFEPFTQTQSWIVMEEYVELETTEPAYIVAWNPEQTTGKLWVATGEIEDFSSDDWSSFPIWLEKVQAFHEVGEGTPVTTGEEESCVESQAEADAPSAKASKTRCSTSPAPATLTLGWLLAGLISLRRRGSCQR